MIKDRFLSLYLQELTKEVNSLKDDLATVHVDSIYSVGRTQGKIEGLRQAITVLNNLAEELDT